MADTTNDPEIRHALARTVIEALSLIYSDDVLSAGDRDVVSRGIEVLTALANRGQKEKADALSTFA
jgi:hypothetical protein